MSVPPTPPVSRIPEFDGLRGLAIALVLWHHLVEPYLPPGASHWLGWVRVAGNLAWCGVDLFFVLSGFFIGGILIDQRDSPRLAKVFYLRRALRILPLYYVTLLVALAVVQTTGISPWAYALFLTNFALALQNHWELLMFSVLWSLAVEEQFYLIAPWVVRWITPARLPVLLVGLILTAVFLRAGVKWNFPKLEVALHVLTPLRMDSLALGALVAWAVRAPAARPYFERLRTTWPVWLLGALALLAALTANRPSIGSPMLSYLGYSVVSFSCALLVAIVAGVRPAGLNRLLALSPLAHLGRHSYFIYLWHATIGLGLINWLGGRDFLLNSPSSLGVMLLAVAAPWLAGMISWKFFEAPFIRWGQRHTY